LKSKPRAIRNLLKGKTNVCAAAAMLANSVNLTDFE
jgi:hypothetical protein